MCERHHFFGCTLSFLCHFLSLFLSTSPFRLIRFYAEKKFRWGGRSGGWSPLPPPSVYSPVVKSSKIENATFPYRTALSEANVTTYRMGSTKWAYHKERSFASNYFILENFVSVKEPLMTSWLDVPTTQMFIFILFVSNGVLLEGTFAQWLSLSYTWQAPA